MVEIMVAMGGACCRSQADVRQVQKAAQQLLLGQSVAISASHRESDSLAE